MKREYPPIVCEIIRAIDLEALTTITEAVINQSIPVVQMLEEESICFHEQVVDEVKKLWDSIDPGQLAYIIKESSQNEWRNPEIMEFYYGLSVEDVILDCVNNLIEEDLEDILSECLGPGEECAYHLYIRCFDDDVMEERLAEADDYFFFDPDQEDYQKDESSETTRTLSNSVWKETGLLNGYTLEVTGEKAMVYQNAGTEERLVIPRILKLLKTAKHAKPNCWHEHLPGWKFKLVKNQVSESTKQRSRK